MQKIVATLLLFSFIFSACNKKYPIDPLPADTTLPSFSNPVASMSAAVKFISFGDTLPDFSLNRGYEIKLSDSNQVMLAACSGIVSAISTNADGSVNLLVKFKSNSIYSFWYGGVRNAVVHMNDHINGGTILGRVAGTGVIDFWVIKNDTEVLCPQTLGSTGFNNSIQQAIDKHNQNNPTDSVFSACLVSSLPR